MRVFICSYSGFSLAIPAEFVSSIFLFNDTAENNTENYSIYSLPVLIDLPELSVRHGVILKKRFNAENIILLTTEIESETEIPDDNFFPLPKTLVHMRFLQFINGIYFNAGKNTKAKTKDLVLLLNPEQLVHNIYQGTSND